METLSRRSAVRAFVVGSVTLGSLAATGATFAEDSNDDHDDSSSSGTHFAAFIYAGTVDALDQSSVVTDIDDLELESDERENDDDHEADDDRDRDHQRDQSWQLLGNGQVAPDELYTGYEDLDDSIDLDALTAEPHMVVVHETASQDSPVIAVGAIDGDVTADGTLLIQLAEHEGSGYEGRAWFGPKQDDDDEHDDSHELEVVVGVYPVGAVQPLGTPSARG